MGSGRGCFYDPYSVNEFKNDITEALNRMENGGECVLLQRHGKDVAALVSLKELKLLEAIEEMEDQKDLKVLKKIKSGQTDVVSLKEAKKELGL